MSKTLIQRFQYGNSDWPSPFSPQGEIVYETPRREREMIHVGRQQTEALKEAGNQIAKSNLIGAHIIAATIQEQTARLEHSIVTIGSQISDAISDSADQITDAIESLGDRLCVELTEIKWQLTQQNITLEKILEVLYESRNNVARQLVRQGLRLYCNNEFDEAEERFQKALIEDKTDYQVLMNLAFIEIHKENPSQALHFFNKALLLPDNLDSSSKTRALWAMARLYYADMNFEKAYNLAKEAFKYDDQNDPKAVYTLGVYAALLGDKVTALKQIEQSILINSSYFSKCTIEPDLQVIKQDILSLLGKLSINEEHKIKKLISNISNKLSKIENDNNIINNKFSISSIQRLIVNIETGLKNSSYEFLIQIENKLINIEKTLVEVIYKIKALISLYSASQNSTSQKIQQEEYSKYLIYKDSYENFKSLSIPDKDFPQFVYTILGFITYLLPGFIGLTNSGSLGEEMGANGPGIILLIWFWPLAFVISILGAIVGVEEMSQLFGGCFIGIIIVVIIWRLVHYIKKYMEYHYKRHNQELSSRKKQLDESETKLFIIQRKIAEEERKIAEEEKLIENKLFEVQNTAFTA